MRKRRRRKKSESKKKGKPTFNDHWVSFYIVVFVCFVMPYFIYLDDQKRREKKSQNSRKKIFRSPHRVHWIYWSIDKTWKIASYNKAMLKRNYMCINMLMRNSAQRNMFQLLYMLTHKREKDRIKRKK